jgi:hypothetical protein
MLLASNKQKHKEITKKKKKTQQDRQNAQEQRPSGFTRSSPLTRLYTESFRILRTLKFQKKKFSLLGNPLALFDRIFRGATFSFQKNNKTDHLRDKELLTTTKPQKPVKLTIDNSQLSSNWDIGMDKWK